MKIALRRFLRISGILFAIACVLVAYFAYPPRVPEIVFPGGKKFALTIVDDTDLSTLERISPIYQLLEKKDLKTTKTVWVHAPNEVENYANRGVTLQDPNYREMLLRLQQNGFEIALHGVRGGSSERSDIQHGLERFRAIFGDYPKMQVNHSMNRDNLYWGEHRWTLSPFKFLYSSLFPYDFSGHDPESPFFWGDLAREHIQYVRRFTFKDPNLLKAVPGMPYHVDEHSYVNYWYPGADGGSIDSFEKLLSKDNLDRLEREGGVVLVYAHLGAGSFNTPDGGVNPRFTSRIEDIAGRNGWFVPASTILDFLKRQPSWSGQLSFREQVRLESKFMLERLFIGR